MVFCTTGRYLEVRLSMCANDSVLSQLFTYLMSHDFYRAVCRTKDISLASTFSRDSSGISNGLKERPKLNLTVKKELQGMGGQIMAQSRMAKGPDGTNGFDSGWTTRRSKHVEKDLLADLNTTLSASASEFVPNFSIPASGFESGETGDCSVVNA